MKRSLILLVIVSLLAAALAVPASAEGDYATARTPIADCSDAQMHNILRTLEIVDQFVVAQNAEFSFNAAVGPRTEGNGFVRAVNGRGSKVMGGGVAQVATTMYLALKELDGVAFGDLYTYGSRFTGGYVDNGDLAIVTDYDSGHDLDFVNGTGSPLKMELWTSESYLYCTVTLQKEGMQFGTGSEENWFESAPDPEINGTWSTVTIASARISCGSDSNLLNNIALAADSIYDTTLESGDKFSFNGIVGPREERYGYRSATNGRGVKVTGGGVAQVASVVWMAVKNLDDVSIVEKSTYGDRYNQDYVLNSADAIVTDYGAGTDFAFRYDGEGSITIYTWLENDTLCCDITLNS